MHHLGCIIQSATPAYYNQFTLCYLGFYYVYK